MILYDSLRHNQEKEKERMEQSNRWKTRLFIYGLYSNKYFW